MYASHFRTRNKSIHTSQKESFTLFFKMGSIIALNWGVGDQGEFCDTLYKGSIAEADNDA